MAITAKIISNNNSEKSNNNVKMNNKKYNQDNDKNKNDNPKKNIHKAIVTIVTRESEMNSRRMAFTFKEISNK